MKIQWKNLVTCIAIPLAVGSLSALLSQRGMAAYAMMNKPALSPPGWVDPVFQAGTVRDGIYLAGTAVVFAYWNNGTVLSDR